MAILGLLALVQIVFLPGYLLLRTLRLGAGILATCVLSFSLSLVTNYILVACLVVVGIYRPAIMYAVFSLELLLLLGLDRQWRHVCLTDAADECKRRILAFVRAIEEIDETAAFGFDPSRFQAKNAWSWLARRIGIDTLLIVAITVIIAFAVAGIAEAGRIFEQWDAVVSWNRWALEWSTNRLPQATSIYPQLLPTNMSLTYVFLQSNQVWIFAKAFQFLFCLMLLAAMLDMTRIEGRFGYLAAVPITYALLVALLRYRMLSSGYVDVPLACFALVSLYALLLGRNAPDTARRAKYLAIGALLAAGAAATKQNGLYIAAIYPLLAWQFVLRGGPGSLRRQLPTLLRIGLILGLTVLPWYLYKFFDFQAGCDKNNTALLLTDFHEGRDLLQRVFYAGSTLVEAITPLGTVVLLLALAAAICDRTQRWLMGTLVAPLGTIWAIAFSYDLRNLAVIVPFVGIAAGAGLMQIIAWTVAWRGAVRPSQNAPNSALIKPGGKRYFRDPDSRPNWPPILVFASSTWQTAGSSLRLGHAFALATILVLALCLCVSDGRLVSSQQRQQRLVGMPDLNRQLYAYLAEHPQHSSIATDYQAMRWLPELGDRSLVCSCQGLSAFRLSFDRPDVRYVLVRSAGAATDVRAFLQSETTATFLFENHGFAFYKKRIDTKADVAAVR